MSGPIRARLLPMFPLGVLQGGLELQCLKTCRALQEAGIEAALLDYYRMDDRFDLLHLFGSTENYYDLALQVGERWPIIVSAVTGAPNAAWWRGPIWQTASAMAARVRLPTSYSRLRAVYDRAAVVICLNQLEADFLTTTYRLPPAKVRIVSNGVEAANFGASAEPFVARYGQRDFVLYTGNIVRRKSPVNLARALLRLGIPGVFIGRTIESERGYGEEFRALIESSASLSWIEGLRHDDPLLASAYAAASLFCLPSTNETQSLAALEAMAAGTPVLLGDYPYARQAPFEAAERCDPARPDSIAAGICRVRQVRPRTVLPETFRWSAVARSVARIYAEVLGRPDWTA